MYDHTHVVEGVGGLDALEVHIGALRSAALVGVRRVERAPGGGWGVGRWGLGMERGAA